MKDNIQDNWWEEEMMDKFCVMFERASRDTDSENEWVIKLESFIQEVVEETKRRAAEKVKELIKTTTEPTEVDGVYRGLQVMQKKVDESYNQGIEDAANTLIKSNE